MKFLQKLGKALMLPVACLPLCGILMGIGYGLCPNAMQGGDIKGAKGVTAEILNKASKRHICKINVDTDLRIAYTSSILEHIKNNPQNIDYRKYLGYAIDEVKNLMIEKIKNLGADNQG